MKECRNNLVQESLEHRLDCSSEFASSSDVGNGPSILAAPQSGRPTSISRAHRIALFSMVETSHALKQLSELFQSSHLVSHGSLLLTRKLFGLGVEVWTPLTPLQMKLRILNHTLLLHLFLNLCLSA